MTVNQEEQSKYLSFLQNQLALLKEENFLLKRAIQQSVGFLNVKVPPQISLETPDEEAKSWVDRDKQFAGLRSQLLETAIKLFRIYSGPVSQERIIESWENTPKFRMTARNVGNPETCPRRLRELAQEGYLLRVKDGVYFWGPKLVEAQAQVEAGG